METDTFTPEEELIIKMVHDMRVPTAVVFSDIAFSDLLRPQYCAECLHGAWLRIFGAEDDTALPAAFQFIVSGRTESQMTSLFSHMARCRCADYPHDEIDTEFLRSFHDDGKEAQAISEEGLMATSSHFHSLIKIVSLRLITTLRKTNPIKLARHKGRQEWPTSLDDIILPGVGPDTTIQSLEQWMRHMSIADPWPIGLLGSIAYVARSLITPAILRSRTLIPTILRIALEMCDEATLNLSSTPMETSCQLVWRLQAVSSFFDNFFWQTGAPPGLLDDMHVDLKTGIVQMCARAIDVLKLPLIRQHAPAEDRTALTKNFTSTLTLLFDLDVSPEGIDPTLIQHAINQLNHTLNGPPLEIIPILLLAWKRSLNCYARSCPESIQTSHSFKRCSACKVVSYCGPECQRRAWRDHKPLCRTIAKIVQDGGGDIHSQTFKANCKAGVVDADEAQTVIDAFSAWRRTHGHVHL
ncbi:hypothetical protein C8R44DRAFT_799019 [Mycena epipterygia]|nr:hypothetical protein C8R44DRAFT_799019 [Mycena epipterygia]